MLLFIKNYKKKKNFNIKEIIIYIITLTVITFFTDFNILYFITIIDIYIYLIKKDFNLNSISFAENINNNKKDINNKINLKLVTEGKYFENPENLNKIINDYTKNLIL
jgi:hypothetical protein